MHPDLNDALDRQIRRAQRWLALICGLAVFGIVMALIFGHAQ